ncbi:MAG: cell division protein SepF [Eubacteriales bacterium]|nr:cell division protein SepF [Eubacteriales bacterium]
MANLFDKLFGRYDDDYDDFEEFDEFEDYAPAAQPANDYHHQAERRAANPSFLDTFNSNKNRRPVSQDNRQRNQHSRVLDMRSGEGLDYDQEVIIMVPYNFEVTKQACDYIKAGKTVICNIEKIDNETAQRVLDFIMGATYALSGSLESISDKIFVVTPASTRLSSRLEERQDKNARTNYYSSLRATPTAPRGDRRFETAPIPNYGQRPMGTNLTGQRAANQ